MKIEFSKLPISPDYGLSLYDIYYVTENKRSKVMDNFQKLPNDLKDQIKVLISKMATNNNYKSSAIKYNLKNYTYGEIRPMPHRFFFFQKCGNNYIFFDYVLKKTNSLDDDTYKLIENKKNIYEKEFEKFISKS